MFTQRRLQLYINQRLDELEYCVVNPEESPYPPEWLAGYWQAMEDMANANVRGFKRTAK